MSILYNYERHHWEYMDNCLKNTQKERGYITTIHREWPFDDMVPTYNSLKNRLKSLEHFGVEECINGLFKGARSKAWSDEENDLLKSLWAMHEGEQLKIMQAFRAVYPNRSNHAVMMRITSYQAEGEFDSAPKGYRSIPKDYTEDFLARGLEIVGNPLGFERSQIDYECLDFRHKGRMIAYNLPRGKGCAVCTGFFGLTLTELKNSEKGKQPCKVYLVQFKKDGVLKSGITSKDIEERGIKWPPFDVLKIIDWDLYNCRRIETHSQNSWNRIPLYTPLINDGGTECFEEKYKDKLIEYFNRENNESR